MPAILYACSETLSVHTCRNIAIVPGASTNMLFTQDYTCKMNNNYHKYLFLRNAMNTNCVDVLGRWGVEL